MTRMIPGERRDRIRWRIRLDRVDLAPHRFCKSACAEDGAREVKLGYLWAAGLRCSIERSYDHIISLDSALAKGLALVRELKESASARPAHNSMGQAWSWECI